MAAYNAAIQSYRDSHQDEAGASDAEELAFSEWLAEDVTISPMEEVAGPNLPDDATADELWAWLQVLDVRD